MIRITPGAAGDQSLRGTRTFTMILCAVCFVLKGCIPIGPGNAPGSPPDPTDPVSYGFDIQPIWDKNCVTCHRPAGIAETIFGVRMHLTAGQSYKETVNQRSGKAPAWLLVVPGDPEASLLYRKVRDEQPPVGFRMPLFQPRLLPEEIDLIRRWIEEGALAN